METKKRQVYFDALRILAILCVLFNHSGDSGYFLFMHTDNIFLQIISIAISSFSKIGVPIFFMISGALLLNKEESLKDLYIKRVLRYVIILFVFSTIYYYSMYKDGLIEFYLDDLIRRTTTNQMFVSYWFLYSYLAFLVSLPLMRKMAKAFSNADYLYMLGLYIVGASVFSALARTFIGHIAIGIPFAVDTLCFPLLGYFFAHRIPKEKENIKLLLTMTGILILGITLNVLMTFWDHSLWLDWSEGGLSIFCVLTTISAFYIVKHFFDHVNTPCWLSKIITFLGSGTFGVYILEPYIKRYCGPYIQHVLRFLPSRVEDIIYIFALMFVGCTITMILKQIPLIRKLF